ncbi:hypothetical protein LZC95_31945 [Pendulispora brunnea]|uniref:Uncharacterized protein n=1 Tax=Pendulispora brunnea TaxID=2905690 RepID=A0ABZ2JZ27_9BACT
MTQLNGVRNLRTADALSISGNALTSIEDLHSLTTTRWLELGENSLGNLSGLEALQNISQSLQLDGNARLTTIDHFSSLTRLGTELRIINNASLPACRADAFLARLQALGFDGTSIIHDNGGTGGCVNAAEPPRARSLTAAR